MNRDTEGKTQKGKLGKYVRENTNLEVSRAPEFRNMYILAIQ
jgi:hypothetical protein